MNAAPTLYETRFLPHIKVGGPTSSINPLQGVIDTLNGQPGIGLLFDNKDKGKSYDHLRRKGAPYTHDTLVVCPADRRPYGISFKADTDDETCFDGVENYWGFFKLAHRGIWTPQPARVYLEKRLHDISWFRPLSQRGLDRAEERIAELKEKPPLYQVTSVHPKNWNELHTLNCMSFAFEVIEATGEIDLPPMWKARPWPVVVGNNVAFGAALGVKGNQSPRMTIETFQASAERLLLPAEERITPIRPGTWDKLHPREKAAKSVPELVLATA